MRLAAALAAGVTAYLTVGAALGVTPHPWATDRPVDRGRRRREWLHQAGIPLTPAQFVAASAGAGIAVGLAVWALTRVPALGVVAGASTAWWPRAHYARQRRHRVSARLAAWPDALRDLVSHLRVPLSVHASLVELARTGPEPLRPAFERYRVLATAFDHRRALEVVREELADPVSDRIIEIVLIAFDQGASIVIDVLGDLADATAADLRLNEEIVTAQLETRLEAWGASVLPFAVLGLLCATTPEYRAFYSSPAGWAVLGIGVAMSAAGLVAISRLGRVPAEERILAGGGPG